MDIREVVKWGFIEYFVGVHRPIPEASHAWYITHSFKFPNGHDAFVTKVVFKNGTPPVWGVRVTGPKADTINGSLMTDASAHKKGGIHSILKEVSEWTSVKQ
jgi:hypothetical protein